MTFNPAPHAPLAREVWLHQDAIITTASVQKLRMPKADFIMTEIPSLLEHRGHQSFMPRVTYAPRTSEGRSSAIRIAPVAQQPVRTSSFQGPAYAKRSTIGPEWRPVIDSQDSRGRSLSLRGSILGQSAARQQESGSLRTTSSSTDHVMQRLLKTGSGRFHATESFVVRTNQKQAPLSSQGSRTGVYAHIEFAHLTM